MLYADLTHAKGWIIPSLIGISGYAGGWQSIHILLSNQKKRLSTHSEAKLLNFLVLSALSAFSRALIAAAASSMT